MAFASYLVGWSGSSVFVDLTRSAALGVLSFSMFGSFIHVSWNPQQMSKTLYCFFGAFIKAGFTLVKKKQIHVGWNRSKHLEGM